MTKSVVDTIIKDIFELPLVERTALADAIYAHAGSGAASQSKITLADVEGTLASIPANMRERVIAGLTAKGVVRLDPERALASSPYRGKKTINQIAAASATSIPLLKQIKATAARLGYEVPDDRPVNLMEFDKAVAGKDIQTRLALKSIMRQVGLL